MIFKHMQSTYRFQLRKDISLITEELLSSKISAQLLYEMKQGKYQTEDRLPPELSIAKDLNVSRTAVRDSLAILEREGFISRRHGVGTIINRHVFKVTTRMDLEQEFLKIIACAGYEPGIAHCTWQYAKASAVMANKLAISERDEIIQITKVITADGVPAIYCVDTIAKSIVTNNRYDDVVFRRPIFDFLETYCDTSVFMDLTDIHAVIADTDTASMLQIKEGDPVLYMDEVGYTFRGKPVLASSEYYREGLIRQTVLRKKI